MATISGVPKRFLTVDYVGSECYRCCARFGARLAFCSHLSEPLLGGRKLSKGPASSLGSFNVFTLLGRGVERGERNESRRCRVLTSPQYVQRCSFSRSDSGLPTPRCSRRSCRQRMVGVAAQPACCPAVAGNTSMSQWGWVPNPPMQGGSQADPRKQVEGGIGTRQMMVCRYANR